MIFLTFAAYPLLAVLCCAVPVFLLGQPIMNAMTIIITIDLTVHHDNLPMCYYSSPMVPPTSQATVMLNRALA